MPGTPSHVENVRYQRAKPAIAPPPFSTTNADAGGSMPKSAWYSCTSVIVACSTAFS
jgi:hypothetical protein